MRVVALLIGCALFACTDEGLALDEVSSGVVVNNRLVGNTLSENRLVGNTLASNNLGANRLSDNRFELGESANGLLATEGGREVLSYIISCALDENTILTGSYVDELDEPQTIEFFGDLGLAQSWLRHRLDRSGQGWVSACLFARVNVSAIPVPISLRGAHKRLTADADEQATWSLQEGAFYGNFFTDAEAIDWNACRGADQAVGESAGLISRDCTEEVGNTGLTQCGFNYAGDCGNFADDYACKGFDEDGTFYTKCQDSADYSDGKKSTGYYGYDHKAYKQVITVYVLGV